MNIIVPSANSSRTSSTVTNIFVPASTIESANQIAQDIKNIARRITEGSTTMRDVVRIIHRSGAIDEMTFAMRDVIIAARDTSREINIVAKELREHEIIKYTFAGLDEIISSGKETAQVLRDMTDGAKRAAPNTAVSASNR
jgi:phage terminase large subunit-like protein